MKFCSYADSGDFGLHCTKTPNALTFPSVVLTSRGITNSLLYIHRFIVHSLNSIVSNHGKSLMYITGLSNFPEILLNSGILYSIVPSERVGSRSTSPISWSSSISSWSCGNLGCVRLISGEPSSSLPHLGHSTRGEGVSPSPVSKTRLTGVY